MTFERFKRKIQPVINIYHLFKAFFATIYFGFPSKKLKVIGVTGTDGKTTTSHLIFHILKTAGKKVSIISSVYAIVAGKEYKTGLHVTTPDAIYLQSLLEKAADFNEEYFVLETTSHALDQNRVWGIDFAASVITNITPEHLDYHKSYEKYVKAKAKLLKASNICIINKDDQSYPLLKAILKKKGKKTLTYGLRTQADVQFSPQKEVDENINDFNAYNYLAAYSVGKTLRLPEKKIIAALKSFRLPPGRVEVVYEDDFTIIIDFAHTPNSLLQALQAVKKQYLSQGGRLIHVFGSAGLRDHLKRPLMGQASSTYADVSIVTEEDYRTENPTEIAQQISGGLKKNGMKFVQSEKLNQSSTRAYSIINDRQSSIEKALQIAKKGDVLILTGKSHEKSLARGKKEYPWDEFEAVKKSLKKLKSQ